MACPPADGDNPLALASGLSYVQLDNHDITIFYLHFQSKPLINLKIFATVHSLMNDIS